ncbi:acyl-CoA:lysophosphatidylglycerol acyltransferase 1-like [Malaya genurostris]|uniref:acyl-CoA:lysophosphatidylglycerol acyltransferase 1-like n=1 Tax=Malaya genurostris TaxID=325434 RepID=UPI0026F3B72C|nr:acyl-CoA:lysophosphatidylglycerol acyltransferase 1-like [Malaya genurostris]XP_058446808.1 acyl-CoA:lysophosphatidylglycerol acyltransferase 1-like [Malaya genurostris]XP_058446809.1 acyl-CoA:lysophosphatidylglycerol acyltransferase 1-like [Malaya genurostris]XP_058446810.1 acyl-CoA:lysophosphatidylglycerol acyltransferase 1-like [Malaya genurostris]XP_058446811.1 acyl-CoA:lysophosphatidylglycerol acyltransferase 1-like [Malaya genurostris]XP_058446812.1 acyl-CoA:lysophosphatidylglycerol a
MPSSTGLIDVIKYPRALFRTVFVLVNNIYCVPTYLIWMLLLLPLKKIHENYYFRIEGILFHWLLANVTMWSSSAGYDLVEVGDDITPALDERTLVLANHQSTSDVPLLMAAFNAKKNVLPNIMWIMDRLFKYTNFGAVSLLHQDFFIASGKSNRDKSLLELKKHLKQSYIPRQRRWMVLFPEGGFLRKRKEVSQRYAERNNLPVLNNVTVPRVGAMKAIIDVLGSPDSPCRKTSTDSTGSTIVIEDHQFGQSANPNSRMTEQQKPTQDGTNNNSSTIINSEAIITDDCDNFKDSPFTKLNGKLNDCLEYILDITIGYPNGKPLDLPNIVHGLRKPCQTYLFYRLYHNSQVPRDTESLTQWLYDRFIEKEKLLEEFYRTGMFPCGSEGALVHQDLLRFLLIHLFFITSTYVHYQLILMLINYSNVMYVYLLSNS